MSEQRMMHVLPVEAYTSQEWFNREQELIFSKVWRYGGFVEDITEPGEYISVQAGLNNIFIVMGRDRRLRAFHNLCRHRGTQLLRAVGKTQKAITCPYHDWTYNLEGDLISVPNAETEFPDLDKSCLGLHRASVDLWRGMLWVHPAPNAGSIMEWFGEVEPFLGPHQVDNLIEYPEARTSTEIKANWKIVVENYIDVYHLKIHIYNVNRDNGINGHNTDILARIESIESGGNFGDCAPIRGSGDVFELRFHFGPGYRIYFGEVNNTIVLLLCGGAKSLSLWKQKISIVRLLILQTRG